MRSPWLPAVYLLLDGLGRAAVGMGLLMGQAATVIERHALVELSTPGQVGEMVSARHVAHRAVAG